MGWITEKDDPKAFEMERRWEACTDGAREFAILEGHRWPGVLPHIIAEFYDEGILSVVLEERPVQ